MGEEDSFIGERGRWAGLLKTKSIGLKGRIGCVAASHWLSCGGLSLAGVLPGEEKVPLAGVVGYRLLSFGALRRRVQ